MKKANTPIPPFNGAARALFLDQCRYVEEIVHYFDAIKTRPISGANTLPRFGVILSGDTDAIAEKHEDTRGTCKYK